MSKKTTAKKAAVRPVPPPGFRKAGLGGFVHPTYSSPAAAIVGTMERLGGLKPLPKTPRGGMP